GMRVEPGHSLPGAAGVLAHEERLRRRPGVPAAGLRRMGGCEPEDVRHAFRRLARRGLLERGWRGGFLPRRAKVLAAIDGVAEVARLHRREQRASVAWIDDGMVDGLAEEMRIAHAPRLSPGVGFEDPETLAGRDGNEQSCQAVPVRVSPS